MRIRVREEDCPALRILFRASPGEPTESSRREKAFVWIGLLSVCRCHDHEAPRKATPGPVAKSLCDDHGEHDDRRLLRELSELAGTRGIKAADEEFVSIHGHESPQASS